MRRRRGLAVVASLSVATGFVACSFPDVSFNDLGLDGSTLEASTADAPTADVIVDAEEPDTTAPPQQDVDPEGGAHDAATRDSDAAIDRDAGPDGGGCGTLSGSFCDCDQDESLKEAGACVDPTALRPDCDDFDPLVFPDQDFVAATWDPASPHLPANDWNCDGTVTKQFNYGVGCSLLECTEGFSTDVPCGETGTYNFCKVTLNVILGISVCSVDHSVTRTQGCR